MQSKRLDIKKAPIDIDRAVIAHNKYVSKQEKRKYDKEQFKRYIKNHKGRFAGGLAIAATIAGVTGYGAYKLIKSEKERRKAYEAYKQKGGKKSYQDFKKEILKESILMLQQSDLQYLYEDNNIIYNY